MLYQIFVLIFNKEEILIDDLPEGMRLPLKLSGQSLLLSHVTEQLLKHALLVLLLHLSQPIIDLLIDASFEFDDGVSVLKVIDAG